jgi:flagellar hook assembly protein FlgD
MISVSTILEIPKEYSMSAPFPNPFNPITTIFYSLPQNDFIKISIYNIHGQQVRNLLEMNKNAGTYHIHWDGKNDFGSQMSNGQYVFKLICSNYIKSQKVILLK